MPMERERQRAIERYSLIGFEREPAFDHVTGFAADIFGVPIALVTVLGTKQQYFRGACGLLATGTPRQFAFCEHAVRTPGEVLVVPNAALDDRFRNNPLVTGEPHIRFYAGAPISVEKVAVGSLCVIDRRARSFGEEDRRRLQLLAATVTDIIELRAGSLAAEERGEAVERQAELLKAAVENVEHGIAIFDKELRLILWNGLFFELFGYPPELARPGERAEELMMMTACRGELGPGAPEEIVAGFVNSIRSTGSRRIEIRRTNGRVLDIWRSSMPDGRFILTANDVTEQRYLSRMKDEFISTVSHELRTPLTSIVGSLALIDRGLAGPLSERGRQLVGVASKNGKRLNDLINDLLDIERLGGDVDFEMKRLELGGLVGEAVEQNRPYADGLEVGLDYERAPESLWAEADRGRLLQALSNLISNAAKFSEKGGRVYVSLAHEGRARISVMDCGSGISEEFRPHLFQRFAQAQRSSQRGQSGTGLGLAITKSIVERHGGRIGYETETGVGSTFWFEIPLAARTTSDREAA